MASIAVQWQFAAHRSTMSSLSGSDPGLECDIVNGVYTAIQDGADAIVYGVDGAGQSSVS